MITTIIFDAEGVVLDTESIWDRGQQEFLRLRGLVYDRERIKPLLTGRSVIEGVRVLKREYGIEGDDEELARERIDIVLDFFRDVYFIEGFREFFETINDSYKTCIATSMAEDLLEVVVRSLNLADLFGERIFSLRDVDYRSKPNPDLFLYAARRLGSKPDQSLVIEDSPYGVEAAKRAGMKCIGLTTTYPKTALIGASLTVNSFREIALDKPPFY